jgi:hypothetical protein
MRAGRVTVWNREEPPGRWGSGPVALAAAPALGICGLRLGPPRATWVLGSCPETGSPRQGEKCSQVARVLPGPQERPRPRRVSPGQPSPAAQACRAAASAWPRFARVRCLAGAAAPPMKGGESHPRGDWDLPRKSAAGGMRGRPAPHWGPGVVELLWAQGRHRFPAPQSRPAQAASVRRPGRAPRPTPLDWNVAPAPTPRQQRPRAAWACRLGPRAGRKPSLPNRPACLVRASGHAVSPAWARSIRLCRLPEAVSGEVRVTFG